MTWKKSMSFIISLYPVSISFSTIKFAGLLFGWTYSHASFWNYNKHQAFECVSSKEKDFKKQEIQIITQYVANLCQFNSFQCKSTELCEDISVCNGLVIVPLTGLQLQLPVRFSTLRIWNNQAAQEMAFPWDWKHTACT